MPTLNIWKDTFTANSLTEGYQQRPDVVGLANGNMLVVWGDSNDTVADGAGYDIVGQIYDPMGVAVGGPIFLNQGYGANRAENKADVVATADGGFVITYNYHANNEYDQLFRRFDADGNATQQSYVINDIAGGTYYTDFDIVHRPDGSSIVTYRRDAGTDEDLMYREIKADGSVGAEIQVRYDQDPNGSSQGDPDNPRSDVLEDGRVIVAFQEEDSNVYGPEYSIIGTDGSVSMRGNVTPATTRADDVDVAALKGGGFVVTWREGNVIKGQIYDGSSPYPAKQGGVLELANDSDVKDDPRVVGLPDGGFALSWIDRSDNEISTRMFAADGARASNKRDLELGGADAYSLETALTADGRLMVTWQVYTDATYTESDVAMAILDPRSEDIVVTDGTPTTASPDGSDITGSDADDIFYGLGGEDELSGRAGNDTLYGGNGDDELKGGTGVDALYAGRGHDEIHAGHGDDKAWGSDGRDKIWASLGDDTVWGGDDADRIWGQSGADTLYGSKGDDSLFGGTGSDVLKGGKGSDVIKGGTGHDVLKGESGNDKMWGGKGQDDFYGGTGADVFVFTKVADSKAGAETRDVIHDFAGNTDLIDLRAIDANVNRAGNQAFDYEGFGNYDGAGDLRLRSKNGDVYVQADVDGDGRTDFAIKLENPGTVDQFDFLL